MSKKYIIIFIIVFISLIMLPALLYPDVYKIINNDTQAHIKAFEQMKVGSDYHVLYGAQEITGKFIIYLNNVTGISLETLFMWFNFISLAIAGLSVGLMSYVLTKNVIGFILSSLIPVFGINATLHLFYSGTIFNIIAILIIVPLFVICLAWMLKWIKNKSKYFILLICAVCSGFFYILITYHPALGIGILKNGIKYEAVLNPLESIMAYVGIINIILLVVSIYTILSSKIKMSNLSKIVLLFASLSIIASAIIGYCGLNSYPSRVIINMSLLFILIMPVILGYALNSKEKKLKYSIIIIALISVLPNIISWISNSIVKGLPANVILS